MLDTIRKNLAGESQDDIASGDLTPAAILFPLLYKDGKLSILFTKRTQMVRAHKGQVSFPGGVRDTEDKRLLDTALREAQEEIGLAPKDVDILGSLAPIATVSSGFLIYSFVGLVPYPYPFQLNRQEVEEFFTAPFDYFADHNNWDCNARHLDGQPGSDYSISYGKYLIWGATARILKRFFERVETSVEHTA